MANVTDIGKLLTIKTATMEEAYYKLLNDILRGYNRCTPTGIISLRNNQIFVFGTDRNGSQKHGAAGLAAKCFGAKVGVVDGPTGMCYALPTMGFTEHNLAHAVERFEQYVRTNMKYTYLVTAVGCGHAGFNVTKVANMFKGLLGLSNVMLPEQFLKVYRSECHQYFERCAHNTIKSEDNKDPNEKVFEYYSDNVHEIIRYLLDRNIPFNRDGGFTLVDDEGNVLAEAELGIESEKIVFYPFNSQSEIVFKNKGYKICTSEEYLNSKKD